MFASIYLFERQGDTGTGKKGKERDSSKEQENAPIYWCAPTLKAK